MAWLMLTADCSVVFCIGTARTNGTWVDMPLFDFDFDCENWCSLQTPCQKVGKGTDANDNTICRWEMGDPDTSMCCSFLGSWCSNFVCIKWNITLQLSIF